MEVIGAKSSALKAPDDTQTHTDWIRNKVVCSHVDYSMHVCVCQRSAACMDSDRVFCESRLVTAGSAAEVAGVVLVLHR